MTDAMRSEFEEWAVSEGMPITRGHYYDVYASAETRAAYLAWQAANAAQSVPVVGDVVAITGEPIAILRREIGEDTWFDWTPVLPNSKTHKQLKASGEMDYCEVYQRYTQSIPAAELAILREKAAEVDELRKDAEALRGAHRKLKSALRMGTHSVAKEYLIGEAMEIIDAAIAQGKTK